MKNWYARAQRVDFKSALVERALLQGQACLFACCWIALVWASPAPCLYSTVAYGEQETRPRNIVLEPLHAVSCVNHTYVCMYFVQYQPDITTHGLAFRLGDGMFARLCAFHRPISFSSRPYTLWSKAISTTDSTKQKREHQRSRTHAHGSRPLSLLSTPEIGSAVGGCSTVYIARKEIKRAGCVYSRWVGAMLMLAQRRVSHDNQPKKLKLEVSAYLESILTIQNILIFVVSILGTAVDVLDRICSLEHQA